MHGIKGQDVVILLKLIALDQARAEGRAAEDASQTVRDLEMQLRISKSEVNNSIRRCLDTGLALRGRADGRLQANARSLIDFIRHGVKFVFPAAPGAMTRGMPTAFAAPMLEGLLVSAGRYIYVWPSPDSETVGQRIRPLFSSVPEAARQDARLYEYLALVDAIRLGGRREADLAIARLEAEILAS